MKVCFSLFSGVARCVVALRGLPSTLLLLASACSADAVPEPEPTLETSGAFFAVEVEGNLELYRTLAVLAAGSQDETLFVMHYAAAPRSYDEARELAQDPNLRSEVIAIGRRFVTVRPWQIVWFRSVSPEEQEGFR
jgi:hypothetical protein